MPGPRNRFDRPQPSAVEYTDQRDRDRALEERWSYDRDGEIGTLAFVSAHWDVLVREFMDWYSTANVEGESKTEAVAIWESVRFGRALDRSAHGVLTFQILDAFFPGRHGKKWEKKPEGKPVPKDHAMPALRMGRREIDERLMELERQKSQIGASDER